jgi:hypothetical protein
MSAVPEMIPSSPAVTAQDLELEHAELLPARETLYLGPVNPGGPMYPYPGPVHYPYPGPIYPYPGPVHYYPASVPATGE